MTAMDGGNVENAGAFFDLRPDAAMCLDARAYLSNLTQPMRPYDGSKSSAAELMQ